MWLRLRVSASLVGWPVCWSRCGLNPSSGSMHRSLPACWPSPRHFCMRSRHSLGHEEATSEREVRRRIVEDLAWKGWSRRVEFEIELGQSDASFSSMRECWGREGEISGMLKWRREDSENVGAGRERSPERRSRRGFDSSSGVTGAPPRIKSTMEHDHLGLLFERNIVFQRSAAKARLLREMTMLSK
jgi:hypothetical protein